MAEQENTVIGSKWNAFSRRFYFVRNATLVVILLFYEHNETSMFPPNFFLDISF